MAHRSESAAPARLYDLLTATNPAAMKQNAGTVVKQRGRNVKPGVTIYTTYVDSASISAEISAVYGEARDQLVNTEAQCYLQLCSLQPYALQTNRTRFGQDARRCTFPSSCHPPPARASSTAVTSGMVPRGYTQHLDAGDTATRTDSRDGARSGSRLTQLDISHLNSSFGMHCNVSRPPKPKPITANPAMPMGVPLAST